MTRHPFLMALVALPVLAACAQGPGAPGRGAADAPREESGEIATVVRAPRPQMGANTVDALDTTTEAQRAAAVAPPEAAGERLGEEVAALGDPTEPGLWMRTGLVSARQPGRVVLAGTEAGATVELIPLEGEGGAQLSLATMRLLGVPLTELPTVAVYRR